MYETQIARGMALLDERRPGWRDEIDVDTLHLGDDCFCILGQLDGDYLDARDGLGLTQREARDHGFDIMPTGVSADDPAEYDTLTAEWRQALAQPAGSDR